ncbi:uncharacterized protein LOC133380963 isoform X2 [Rhineura floridana]|uniref:uncharacterized protein LOC133380963 isoform X2 n=1 Tax=Rhineura floridana TaxID=261503 RepID=UPI002AC88B9E|nr:uncharacterized protein LOC133380963 isoform X2 [Rhineura floridana]
MMDENSPKCPPGKTVCSNCLRPCQQPAIKSCGHSFCQACSSHVWGEELKEKVACPDCREIFLRNKPGSKVPLGKMKEPTRLTTIDETKLSVKSICELHKEILDLFCVEDQTPLCSVCRKSWDHSLHTVIPRNQAAATDNQETGSPMSGWEEGFPRSEPSSSGVIGYSNVTTGFKGKGEALKGNEKEDADKLLLIDQWVDFNLEENKEEGAQSNSRVQNSITWIVLILFIIQIVGLVTTVFVFTKAKPVLPATITVNPCCPLGWIMNQGNCYHVLELEGSWDAGQQHCSSLGASLAVVDNLEKLNVAVQDKGPFNHWVGLLRESSEMWKWTDGTVFNNLFEVEGDGRCAYLVKGAVSSADCSVEKKWLCSQKVKTSGGSHGRCRGT